MIKDKVLSLLSIAQKAGKIKSGSFQTSEAVKGGKARLVLVATDASDNSKKDNFDMCSFYKVPCREYATKDDLGRAIGKEERTSVTVCDEGFAHSLEKLLNECSGQER